ncbi:MAG: 50S ribosomal protein L1 [Phycisphaeraceae bacterium]|nr:50S ribosomal protein L1 [Phycisphaeraceae bacterium]
MPSKSKRYRGDLEKVDLANTVPLQDAISQIKSFKATKFDQTVEICMHLGIDAKQADQAVRGSISLPHGVGAARRVVAFCREDQVEAAKAAGAVEAGGEDLVEKVQGGWMEFDVAVASPDMMRVVSKLGKTLGPKGLMPSPKSGSVAPNVPEAVTEFAAGKVEFRNDSGGNVHAAIGKLSFEADKLTDNAQAFIDTILKMKPATTKSVYVKKVSVSATMTPGVHVQV